MQQAKRTETMIAMSGAGSIFPMRGILGKITAVAIETAAVRIMPHKI